MKWSKFEIKYPNLYENSKQLKLPELYHLYSYNDFEDVYEPAEDTFLMIDTLSMEIDTDPFFLNEESTISCEIGCGSSLTSFTFVDKILKTKYNLQEHFCFDVNKNAIEVSLNILDKNSSFNIDIKSKFTIEITSDFFENERLYKSIESNKITNLIFIFNPPYVTTPDDELKEAIEKKNIISSWAGGKNGSEVINRFVSYFIEKVSKFLIEFKTLKRIILYLLLSSENEYSTIIENLTSSDYFVKWECLSVGKYKNERLGIFKFTFHSKQDI